MYLRFLREESQIRKAEGPEAAGAGPGLPRRNAGQGVEGPGGSGENAACVHQLGSDQLSRPGECLARGGNGSEDWGSGECGCAKALLDSAQNSQNPGSFSPKVA
ncbi:hypothetical protein E5288_WYG004421 [Bos mutus]|uniref:Uncharacterized protein n=1 Tax=Bos mutus TaxID=72004 RepID=A0A6B0RXS7_9CETA|nr:hypothetical protein [Bos mutus]